ncbi:MAG: ribonuclease III [Peptococcaceae bacterium]|nr:ribonuclease III [Peptococcaceae bacterium]MDH7525462.1 ribonuclease III [Peptococcaceae bacterium]
MNSTREEQLKELLAVVKVKKTINLELVNQALTHPSYLYESGGGIEHNQRLEFLGDAVIGLIIAQHLYEKYPGKTEGELTKMRAAVVCETSLAEAARALNLGRYILMGKGEEQTGGAGRASNLADCLEAFIGALYLTLGLEKTNYFVISLLKTRIKNAARGFFGDYKTQLQEYIQRNPENQVCYRILQEEGPDHDKTFYAAVYLNEKELARGRGHTKKEAEQMAALLALNALGAE